MEALKEMLYAATEALKPGGRLVVITYHSLEDRMVKNIMKPATWKARPKRFLRERIDPVPASQQQSDCTGRGRDRAQSAFAQRQAENCRKSNE